MIRFDSRFRRLLTGTLFLFFLNNGATAQVLPAKDQALAAINANSALQAYAVRDNIFLLIDPAGGGNVTAQIGDEGVLVVDSGPAERAEAVLNMIRRLTDEPIRYLINTNAHPDYSGGNTVIVNAGKGYAGSDPSVPAEARVDGVAHENVLLRMTFSGRGDGAPNLAFFNDQQDLYFNGETIQVLHQPAANNDGNSVVFFRSSDVLSTGPVFLTTTYPRIDLAAGGSIDGVINALNAVIAITNTRKNQEGGTLVISGEGGVTDEAGVVEYRDMLAVIRARIAYYANQGMSLAEIQETRPTFDYDGRYAADNGYAEADEFVATVYRSLFEERN